MAKRKSVKMWAVVSKNSRDLIDAFRSWRIYRTKQEARARHSRDFWDVVRIETREI